MAGDEPMEGFPLAAEFLDHLDGEVQDWARELLDEFSASSIWLMQALHAHDEDEERHQSAHMLIGLAHTLTDAVLRIAQIETAKSGSIGLDVNVVMGTGRSVFSALALASIRFGQRNPDAFGGTVPIGELEAAMASLLDVLREGGEAEDDDTPITDR